jgi:hypothetical protein
MTRPPSDRGQGRKPNAPVDQTQPRSIRLTERHWRALKELGVPWLIQQIERAVKRKAKEPK